MNCSKNKTWGDYFCSSGMNRTRYFGGISTWAPRHTGSESEICCKCPVPSFANPPYLCSFLHVWLAGTAVCSGNSERSVWGEKDAECTRLGDYLHVSDDPRGIDHSPDYHMDSLPCFLRYTERSMGDLDSKRAISPSLGSSRFGTLS